MRHKISVLVIIMMITCFDSKAFENNRKDTVPSRSGPTLNIGSELQLFIDDYIVEKTSGNIKYELHHPEAREIAIEHDAPWEGSGSSFHSVFKDGDKLQMIPILITCAMLKAMTE